jgi:hypothetical protein
MARTKKDKPLSIRLPEKTKMLIHKEADKNTRYFNDELIVLLTEALHGRNHNMKDYV